LKGAEPRYWSFYPAFGGCFRFSFAYSGDFHLNGEFGMPFACKEKHVLKKSTVLFSEHAHCLPGMKEMGA
jgi:hypothetical protein